MGYGLVIGVAEAFVVAAFDEIDRVVGHPAVLQRFIDDVEFMPAAAVLRLAVDIHDVVGGGPERVAAVLGDIVGVAGAFRENLPSI